MVPNLPFLGGDLIKETLLLDSFYQNAWVLWSQQLGIDCEALYFLEELRQEASYCFQHSLLNGIMMVGRMLFLLLNWAVLWEIHGNHILHHHVNHHITPKTRPEMETPGEIIDITSYLCNAPHSEISLSWEQIKLHNILSRKTQSLPHLHERQPWSVAVWLKLQWAMVTTKASFVGWGNIFDQKHWYGWEKVLSAHRKQRWAPKSLFYSSYISQSKI